MPNTKNGNQSTGDSGPTASQPLLAFPGEFAAFVANVKQVQDRNDSQAGSRKTSGSDSGPHEVGAAKPGRGL